MTTPFPSVSRPAAWWLRGLALALGLALTGCGEEELPSVEPRLEVGTGRQFTELTEDAPLQLQSGCQGGQHVFVSLKAWGLAREPHWVELSLTRTEDEQVVSVPYRVRLTFLPGDGAQVPDDLPGLLLVVGEPEQAIGRRVRLTASVETAAGQRLSDTHEGLLEWGPGACR